MKEYEIKVTKIMIFKIKMQQDGPECTPTYLLFTANLDGAKSSSTRLRQNLMLTPFLSGVFKNTI